MTLLKRGERYLLAPAAQRWNLDDLEFPEWRGEVVEVDRPNPDDDGEVTVYLAGDPKGEWQYVLPKDLLPTTNDTASAFDGTVELEVVRSGDELLTDEQLERVAALCEARELLAGNFDFDSLIELARFILTGETE